MKISVAGLSIALLFSVSTFAQGKSEVEGVWSLTEITTTGTDARTRPMTQPSMYIFTKKHYSVTYVSSAAPRDVSLDAVKMTAEQLRDVFVDSFVANAGTYDTKGGKLTVRPAVAKSPAYMQAGNFTTWAYKISGNTMTLVSDSSAAGPVTDPTTYKLKRVE